MKITKTINVTKEVEVEIELPFYGRDERDYLMATLDEKGNVYGIKVWLGTGGEAVMSDIIWTSDIGHFPNCTEKEFWTAFEECSTRLNKKAILCKSAKPETVIETFECEDRTEDNFNNAKNIALEFQAIANGQD